MIFSLVQVSHNDCSKQTENNPFFLNQIKPCNMPPHKNEMNDEKFTINTKHFRSGINATIRRIKKNQAPKKQTLLRDA